MNEWSRSISKMRKYYFAIVTMTADWLILDKDGLHKMFKIGFKKKTTSNMSFDEWYEYLENVLDFIWEVRGRIYDSDRRHNEQVSFYDLPDCYLDRNLL